MRSSLRLRSKRLWVGVILLPLAVSTVVAQSHKVDVEEDSIPAFSQSLEQLLHTSVPLKATFSNLPSKPSTTPILSPTWQPSHGAPATRSFPTTTTTTDIIGSDPATGLLPPSYNHGTYEPLTQKEETSDKLLNLYFLLLAVGVVVAFAAVWMLRRRRKSKGERAVQRGQVALRRDLEAGGWSMGVGRWGGSGSGGEWAMSGGTGREEGLDERGEAPPPYYAPPREGSEEEGYPLPRMPESAATTTRPSGSGSERGALGVGLPRYDDVVDIRRTSGINGNGGSEVVITPPAVGTGLSAVHVVTMTAPSPMERT